MRGLKLMTPDAAVALVDQVKQTGEWETQRREEWQTVWKPQVITLSVDDPYKVQIVGHQTITNFCNSNFEFVRRPALPSASAPDP